MGEFDKCHIYIGIFIGLDSLLGLTCVILQFMRVFLRLRSVWLVRVLIADLRMSSQVLEKHEIEANPSQERLQKRPNRPKTEDPKQNPRTRKKHKMQRSRSGEHGLARKHHGQPVVFITGRGGPLSPPVVSFSFAAVRFPARFSSLCCVLPLKRRMYLA